MSATPPVIPERSRQHGRRRSLPTSSPHLLVNEANRVHVRPASPEVISNLITTLSIISSPANRLFEQQAGSLSLPASPSASQGGFAGLGLHTYNSSENGGSFGIDYGAFHTPSIEDMQEDGPLDELPASPPVIRTAKPPSGFSPLTAPKPTKDSKPLKTLLRSSRPTSKDSGPSKDHDELSSIGGLSIEPGVAPPAPDLKRRSSSESWGKKQSRNQRGLMYMSSKERLRESERKKSLNSNAGTTRSLGGDEPSTTLFEPDTFMAEVPINEETGADQRESNQAAKIGTEEAGVPVGSGSPAIGTSGQSGFGQGRFIPARDSSLRKAISPPKKRSSNRSSRQSAKQTEKQDNDALTSTHGAASAPRVNRASEKKHKEGLNVDTDIISKLQQPLNSPESMVPSRTTTLASKQVAGSAMIDERRLDEFVDEGAPAPAVAQRSVRHSAQKGDKASNRLRNSASSETDSRDRQSKKDGGRAKRLSAPLSPHNVDKEYHHRSASQPLSKRDTAFSEPNRPLQINLDDRPSSADSIDDAVDAYLRSPRLSQKIRHPQTGRTISFSEVGDPEGFAVFCCVGMGLTRYITAFYDELALTLKLRLITPDRPGVGDSEPYTDGTATPLSWPDDVYAICQTLKVTKFSILAHSAGAIYALATALRMPQHIRGRIHLLAPWIPPSQMTVFGTQQTSPPNSSLPTSQRILRALPTPILKAANSSFMSATSTSITSSLPKSPRRNKRKSTTGRETPGLNGRMTVTPGPDKENQGPESADYLKPSGTHDNIEGTASTSLDLTTEAAVLAAAANSLAEKERQMIYDTRLTHAIWELATSGANPAVDLLVCLERRHTIGFRYVDITRAVVIHHGSKDTRVPVDNVRWLGKMMRRCEVRVLEGEGHGLMASAGVMGGVLMEIAKEWEDWMRLVNQKGSNGIGRSLKERSSIGAFR